MIYKQYDMMKNLLSKSNIPKFEIEISLEMQIKKFKFIQMGSSRNAI
jgi:hypothetical protein